MFLNLKIILHFWLLTEWNLLVHTCAIWDLLKKLNHIKLKHIEVYKILVNTSQDL